MLHYKYKLGQKAIFQDDNQCEIQGIIIDVRDLDDEIRLTIDLTNGTGIYKARIIKCMDRLKFNKVKKFNPLELFAGN